MRSAFVGKNTKGRNPPIPRTENYHGSASRRVTGGFHDGGVRVINEDTSRETSCVPRVQYKGEGEKWLDIQC